MRRRIDLYAANAEPDERPDERLDERPVALAARPDDALDRLDDRLEPPERPAGGADGAAGAATVDRSTLARALAELEASKARVERDAQRAADELRAELVTELLPVLDNLDRMVAAAAGNRDAPAVLEGARLVRAQFETVLQRYGVERLDALHLAFDPTLHDAVGLVPVSQPEANGRVIEEVAPGYRFGPRLLRAAKVVVGRYAPRVH